MPSFMSPSALPASQNDPSISTPITSLTSNIKTQSSRQTINSDGELNVVGSGTETNPKARIDKDFLVLPLVTGLFGRNSPTSSSIYFDIFGLSSQTKMPEILLVHS